MDFKLNPFLRSIRGFFMIGSVIFLVAFIISQIIFPLTSANPAVENPAQIPAWRMLAIFVICLGILLFSSTPITVLFTGLLFGGSASNFFESRLFGPVDDYIYVIGSGDRYCNIADLAILAGVIIMVVLVVKAIILGDFPVKPTILNESWTRKLAA